jgi:hypothetical protein
MATKSGGLVAAAYHRVMRDGTIAAIAREAVKDIRSTIMEIFFGKAERGSEPGTPLTPLFYDQIQSRKSHGGPSPPQEHTTMKDGPNLPTPSQVIDNPQAFLAGQGRTHDNTMEKGNDDALPTPSQVIDNPNAYQPEQSPGQEQQNDHGHEM